jgi:hypothetical protein
MEGVVFSNAFFDRFRCVSNVVTVCRAGVKDIEVGLHKKNLGVTEVSLLLVGAEGFEPPTLCL